MIKKEYKTPEYLVISLNAMDIVTESYLGDAGEDIFDDKEGNN